MAFTGKEGGEITIEQGANMTENYRNSHPEGLKGHFFGRDILEKILKQEGCVGIRMYYGLDEDDVQALVIVGADADENDMTGLVADISTPCPSRCGASNDLNS